jgi:hypothetical protein
VVNAVIGVFCTQCQNNLLIVTLMLLGQISSCAIKLIISYF